MPALKDGERRVNRTVHYVTAAGNIKPAIITALGAGSTVTLRIARTGQTFAAVALMTSPTQASRWYPGSRRRYIV